MAAGATYEPIATTTLGSSSATITFSSIPATYTDLRLILAYKPTSTGAYPYIQFNGDTATNYSRTRLSGDGTSAASNQSTNQTFIRLATTMAGGSWGFNTVDVFSYAGSTYKTSLTSSQEDQNGSGYVDRQVALWRSTSAITSIVITANTNAFDVGTTATLYGIKSA